MRLVTVIPIAKGVGKENLTYFTSKKVVKGSLVSVPLRNKFVDGLVIKSEDASLLKTRVRQSPFVMKKVSSVKYQSFFLESFIEACSDVAEYFAGTTGAVINAMTPKSFADLPALKTKKGSIVVKSKLKTEKLVIQENDTERMSAYKSIIREKFAKKQSVFFCLPEINAFEKVKEVLERGIENYTFFLNGSMSKKELEKTWGGILKEKHAVLIIATGSFLSIPREDIKTIILDKESSSTYKMQTRPFVDIRKFAEILAEKSGAQIIFGDIFLRPETIYRQKTGEFTQISSMKFRSIADSEQIMVDTRPKEDADGNVKKTVKNKKVELISYELEELIRDVRENNEHLFIFCARRGLFPFTICNDCGHTLTCQHCSAPVVLHKKGLVNFFMCHKCGHKRDAQDKCDNCGGWKLATLGIGTENAVAELESKFPDTSIFRMDSDITKTHKKRTDAINKFYSTPGSILLGTEMAVPYLDKKMGSIAILSIDSLLTIPDFRIGTRIFNIIIRLRDKASQYFLVQSKEPENKIFKYAMKGNMLDFYKDEIKERENFDFPPFRVLIKITLEGKKDKVEKEAGELAEKFKEYQPDIFPSFISKIKNNYRMNALIRIKQWPEKNLLEKLKSLPISMTINVEPDNLL